MNKCIKWLITAFLAGMTAFALLCLVCFFYSNIPVHYASETGVTEYYWEKSSFYCRMTEGFGFGRTNNEGFNDLRDYHAGDRIDVLLMGSSQMDAQNVRQQDSTAAQLDALFGGDKTVYNIGTAGHTMLYCVKHLDAALKRYQPKVVVIEYFGDGFSAEELQSVLDGTLPDIPSHNEGIVGMLQHIPLLRLLYSKLLDGAGAESADMQTVPKSDGTELIAPLIEKVDEICRRHGVRPVILNYTTFSVDPNGIAQRAPVSPQTAAMREECARLGITFTDVTDSFMELYNTEHIMSSGFANTEPGWGHLNKHGHRVIAEVLYKLLRETEG